MFDVLKDSPWRLMWKIVNFSGFELVDDTKLMVYPHADGLYYYNLVIH